LRHSVDDTKVINIYMKKNKKRLVDTLTDKQSYNNDKPMCNDAQLAARDL